MIVKSTGCGLSKATIGVSKWQGQESDSCWDLDISVSQSGAGDPGVSRELLVFGLCENPEEVGFNTSEGVPQPEDL